MKLNLIISQTIRLFLLFEAAAFVAAASVHFGLIIAGYEHQKAGVAESVIAAVLIIGLAVTSLDRTWTRRAGLAAQAFALVGTLIGVFTIVIGVGPRNAARRRVPLCDHARAHLGSGCCRRGTG